ncbi:MAG: ribosomal RNA small subunit methyltransferase A [Clostridia bacterium]|nr:ribosomal RNA small subunit methyltransferase A [Clostridia bacterium]
MQLKEVLIKNGFHFNKRYGQNFLTDTNLLRSIVEKAGITENDTVVEIGVGGGTLTRAIAEKAKRVIGFEIDLNLKPVLAETLSDLENVEIIYKDVMKMKTEDIETLIGGRFSVVANLPYYITTPILMKFIEESDMVDSITVTVQEEVADRLCARAGSSEYGAITASVDAVGNAQKIMRIDRKMFYPAPNVDSAVVKIDIDKNKYNIKDMLLFRAVVRCAFLSRRKTLVNNLMMYFKIDRKTAEEIVLNVKGDASVRGEVLNTLDFVNLQEEILKRNIKF